MTNTDDLVESSEVAELASTEHPADDSRLSDLVVDLDGLESVRVGRAADAETIVGQSG